MMPRCMATSPMTFQADIVHQVDAFFVLELPSVGSAQHVRGQCKPCAHSWRPQGCFKGSNCEFCHICDETAWREFRKKRISQQRTRRRCLKKRSGKQSQSEESDLSSSSSHNVQNLPASALFNRDLIRVRKTFIEMDDSGSDSDVIGSMVRCASSPSVLQQQQPQPQR
mmetsp:Transcript_57737/g.114545  ORF Transcript_57737/g.114545 Transcript_57737/m.114545 type:complete len:168 (-) Transcript_57737:556-1059(-)